MHNTISLDGALKDFEINLELHYQIATRYAADVHLVGSQTAKTGIDSFTERIPREKKADFVKPEIRPDDERPSWTIVDSQGLLKDLLHVLRRSEYCKEVIILVSKKTPKSYIKYLKDRHYDIIVAGEDRVDIKQALEVLYERYYTRTVLTDTGGTLTSILLENGLVDRISLLISPLLVGGKPDQLFERLKPSETAINLRLLKMEIFDENYVLLLYRVLK